MTRGILGAPRMGWGAVKSAAVLPPFAIDGQSQQTGFNADLEPVGWLYRLSANVRLAERSAISCPVENKRSNLPILQSAERPAATPARFSERFSLILRLPSNRVIGTRTPTDAALLRSNVVSGRVCAWIVQCCECIAWCLAVLNGWPC